MSISGTIEQAPSNGYYFTDVRTNDIVFRAFSGASYCFGAGSNVASTLRVNSNIITMVPRNGIGIGTDTPQASFHIYNGTSNPTLMIDGGGQSNIGTLRLATTNTGNYIQSGTQFSNNTRADLIFTSMGGTTEWMRIRSSNGNIGIGTSTPTYKLDVSGDINFSGTMYQNGTLFNSGSYSNISVSLTTATPSNGYTLSNITVPYVDVSTITSGFTTSCGSVALASYNASSLAAGASISITLQHNLGQSNYSVYIFPEKPTNVAVDIVTKNTNNFVASVKNISNTSIANPTFNYMLVYGTQTSQRKVLASKVTLAYTSSNLVAYSGASSSNTQFSLVGAATDPAGYTVTYSNMTNSNNAFSMPNTTTLRYVHQKTNRTTPVTILATNSFNTDSNNQMISYNVVESNLSALSFTNSFTSNMTVSGVGSYSYALPATDQGLALSYTISNNGGVTSSVSGTTLNFNNLGSTGTRNIVLQGGLSSTIMTQAALSYRTFTFTMNETYAGLYAFTSHTFTNAGATGRTGPTLAQCRSAYSSASWTQNSSFFNMTTQGVQLWTVPSSGQYYISMAGAAGGDAPKPATSSLNTSYTGGRGIIGDYTMTLTQGDVLSIIIGQKGTTAGGSAGYNYNSIAGGGGGGTWILYQGTIYAVVGGGGGAIHDGTNSVGGNGVDAPISASGTKTNGALISGTGQGGASSYGGGLGGGGGAGWLSDGASSSGTYTFSSGGPNGGQKYVGGLGRYNSTSSYSHTNGDGGFGGGGGIELFSLSFIVIISL